MKTKSKYLLLTIILLILIIPYHKKNIIVTNQQEYLVGNLLEEPEQTYNNDYYSSYGYNESYNYEEETLETPVQNHIEKKVNGYLITIEDDARLLTESEKNKLIEKMEKITEYGNVAFKSINSNPKYSTSKYAEQYYRDKFGKGSSGTLFLVDMYYRIIYIYSEGAVYRTITTAKANTITDNVYKYASRKEYYECAEEAFNEINILLEGGKINEPMKYIANTILSLVIAALLGFLLSLKKASLKNPSANDIAKLLKKKVQVLDNITATKTGQKSVYNPPSSSSSSGGHSSGGGGGSSGGGGGHRF